jgi:ribosomal protein S21
MTLNVEITKSGNENSISLVRKFSQKMRSTGILRKIRDRKYWTRNISPTVKKKQALRRIDRTEKYAQLVKEGKAPEQVQRGRRR